MLTMTASAVDVPQDATIVAETTVVTTTDVAVVAIHHPTILIKVNKDTGELSLSIVRDLYLSDGTMKSIRKVISQERMVELVGEEGLTQAFALIESGLQADVNESVE